MRFTLVLAAAVALTLMPSAAHAEHRPNSYYSESGDVFTRVDKDNGVRLRIGSLAFSGRYRLCVTDPDGERTCNRFRLRENDGGVYTDSVRWARQFPTSGPGDYRVTWHKSGSRIGPVLGFHIK